MLSAKRGTAAGTAQLSRTNVVRVAAYRDSRPLREIQERQRRHILSTYNKAYAFFPKVKFVLKHNSRLGEVWKVSGDTPELGNWNPEISPTLSWREGGVWSCEVPLSPGTYQFKCMLRTYDGYVWETGSNRTVTVPIKDRPGNFVITYHMDVRTEPVEPLPVKQQQQPLMQPAGRYSPMEQQGGQQEAWEQAMANGRVAANAW